VSVPRLNAQQRAAIDAEVDDIFDTLLTRLLGGAFTGKKLFIGYTHDFTLPGIFSAAVSEEGGRVDTEIVEGIASVAEDFINKHRAQAKADTKRRLQGLLHDIDQGQLKPEDWNTAVEGELAELWGKVKNGVQSVVASETQHAQTIGVKEGIDQVNDGLGVEDPVVCFIPVKDTALCKECRRVHLLPDGFTPRVFRSSEVSTEYHIRGENVPSWHLMHPHCRCALATVLPGFGFDGQGRISWVHADHREYDYQHGFKERPTSGLEARRKKLGLNKTEDEFGEPLMKYDVKYADLKRALEHYGWAVEREDGGHVIWNHPSLPTARPIPMKRNHVSGAKPIDDDMLRNKYLKQAGLTIDRKNGQVIPLARHDFAPHYRALGYEVPGFAEEKPETKTWSPAGHEGLVSAPIAQVIPTNNHEEWKTSLHEANFARGQGHKVPPVTAMDQGNGTWLVDQGHEQLEAARRSGMTHIPLKPL
jgi:predicted RNA binding protein YcfA (HicA-like mRNA interferase family)